VSAFRRTVFIFLQSFRGDVVSGFIAVLLNPMTVGSCANHWAILADRVVAKMCCGRDVMIDPVGFACQAAL
jgi:hypothetical protein